MATKLDKWMEAQRRHRLSDVHVMMARELNLNPDKLGKIDNHGQESWKAPLPQFIEQIYYKRFKREKPLGEIKSLRQIVKEQKIADEKKKKDKLKRKRTMENRQIILVFDNKGLSESMLFSLEDRLYPFSAEDILAACESKATLGGRHFRQVFANIHKIAIKDIGVLTLEEFENQY